MRVVYIVVRQPLPIFLLHETRLARRCRDLGRGLHLVAGAELVRETDSGGPDSRPEFTQAQEGFALVVVTRDKSLTALACTARLHVDGTLVADLRPREQIRLFLEEGQHLVGVSAAGCIGGADQTSINVSRTRPVLLRIAAAYGYDLTIELSDD